MKKVLYLLSFAVMCVLLASCGEQSPMGQSYGAVLGEVETATGYSFDTLDQSEVQGNSNTAVFLRSNEVDENTAALTITESNGDTTWAVNVWQGNDLLTISSTGDKSTSENARDLEADESIGAQGINPKPTPHPGGCWKCAKTERVPGHYKSHIITEWIREGLSVSSAAACASRGGSWGGATCYVLVKKLTEKLEWVPGYTKCVKRKHVSPCPNPNLIGLPNSKE